VHLGHVDAVLFVREVAHLGVGAPVVQGNRREVVERLVQVVRDAL